MPSMNTEDDLTRWEKVRNAAAACGGAFIGGLNKYSRYGEYSFDAAWNPKFVEDPIFRSLTSTDILCLVDGGPWFFGGKIRNRDNTRVSGVVYTD